MRSRFMALRDLPEEARAKAAGGIRADIRARIEQILQPEQKTRYAEIVAELGARAGAPASRGRIWVLRNGKPTPIDVRVGLTDGTASEISAPGVVEGLEVIVGQQGRTNSAPAQKGAPPRMFF
jgi:hypothetical protein